MLGDFTYWTWLGTIYLIWLTVQDYRNNRMVDDRKNYFMMGLTISLISHFPSTIWFKLILIGIIIVFNRFAGKLKVIGEADINSMSWIILGFGFINVYYLAGFFIIWMALTSLFIVAKKLFKHNDPVMYYGVILLSYFLTCIILGLY